jgi:hypothetical protein
VARPDRALPAGCICLGKRTASAEFPELGSRLASDDARNSTFPASMVAWSSLGNAVDHLGLAEDVLRREGGLRLRPMAFYTVCRGALVAASQAVWVMTGSQQTRLRRIRLLELEEAESFSKFLKDYQLDHHLAEDSTDELAARLQAKASQVAQRAKELRREVKPKPGEYSVTRTLRDTAREVSGESPDRWLQRAYMFEWRAASGDAHARLWSRTVRPNQNFPLVGQQAHIAVTTASLQTYGQSLATAVMATRHAFLLWDNYRVRPSS